MAVGNFSTNKKKSPKKCPPQPPLLIYPFFAASLRDPTTHIILYLGFALPYFWGIFFFFFLSYSHSFQVTLIFVWGGGWGLSTFFFFFFPTSLKVKHNVEIIIPATYINQNVIRIRLYTLQYPILGIIAISH